MKTSDTAINKIYAIIKASPSVTCPIYLLTKKENNPNESKTAYIVINTLPIGSGVLQKTRVNVNYHCPDLSPGVPDYGALETMTGVLVPLLENVYQDKINIEVEEQKYYSESQLDEHYSNIRLNVKILN